ncbi:hypothetical protein MA16_Dca004421 [Dendrobium catenatum]|uniref:Uncharacterized protein n=1 Tax=Dendrobium catenatum TaxID=906689 RepID=A0A2I0W7E3_9ASPA|nr:hypothetical protein MA16_Dca004421 [Dendrobium catenatum]
MAHSSTTRDFHSSPISASNASDVSDNNLQHFFVLHKAPARKCERKSSSTYRRTKRKIDMLLSSPMKVAQEENDATYEQLRLEAFENTWSKINSTVKEVSREINLTLFEEIHQWVFESFSTIRSTSPVHIMKPYPIAAGATCKRIPAALIFTKNIEFVDDMLMFQDLKGYMQSNGCHAAFLSALDISTKCGIGSCLRSLYKQLVPEASDVVDVPLIASWYCKDENYDKPIAVIIEDMERCDSAVLADFIKMLSEWVMKIPIIFILGVTTSFDALRKLLPSSVMHNLQLCKFTLESPIRRMDSLIENILVRSSSGFFIGHKVALFLRNYFLRHDGTITSFLKALKLACIKHFSGEPLSFLCPGMLHEDCELLVQALIGDPRSVIHDDLLKSDEYLQSTSCSKREHVLSSSIHDTAIMYSLAQEYGDLINLHDWYHSFKTKILISNPKAKRKAQHSPTSKKGKSKALENEVSIQARFCKAVTELQITGLVRMPSKRRPDFLQRIVFDL